MGSSGSSCEGESPGQIQLSLKIQPCLTATQKASCGEWLSRPSGCCIPGLHGEWSSQHPSRVSVFRRTSPYSRSVFHLSSPLMRAHLRLRGLAVGPSCSSEVGVRRAGSAVFRPTGMKRILIERSCPCFSPPSRRSPWSPSSLPFCAGSHPRFSTKAVFAVLSRGTGPSSLCPELQLGLDRRKFARFKVISFCNRLAKKDVHKDGKKKMGKTENRSTTGEQRTYARRAHSSSKRF